MFTLGELRANRKLLSEYGEVDVLIAAADETVVQKEARATPQATMVFEHETMKMMMSERAERIEKLGGLLADDSIVIPLRKKDGSFWDYVTLGRASTADITIDDPAISNVHAHFALEHEGHRACLQDVGSSNGTHVNREKLQPHTMMPLRSGDVVRFGQTIFYYIGNSTLRILVTGETS